MAWVSNLWKTTPGPSSVPPASPPDEHGQGVRLHKSLEKKEKPDKEKLKDKIKELEKILKERNFAIDQHHKEYYNLQMQHQAIMNTQITKYQNLKIAKDREIKGVDLEIRNLRLKMDHLVKDNDNANLRSNDLSHEIGNLKAQLTADRQRATMAEATLKARVQKVLEDNDKLRGDLVAMTRPQQPLYGEDHYIHGLQDLNNGIQSWLVGLSRKTQGKESLTQVSQTKILGKLKEFGSCGQNSAKQLGQHLEEYYGSKVMRIPLLRHIVGLFLFDRIFDPFAYPMPNEISDWFKCVEDNLFKQGS
jgi:hypothetical protein